MRRAIALALAVAALVPATAGAALDASDFASMVGFSVVAFARVKADYYGVEPGTPVELDNGMVFAFPGRFSTYTYRPGTVVFAKPGPKGEAAPSAYKLLIQDRLYDAKRLK